MNMLESEARTKWCPMVRHSQTPIERECTGEVYGINRYGLNSNPLFAQCIGSDCAMWVWKGDAKPQTGCDGWGRCGLRRN